MNKTSRNQTSMSYQMTLDDTSPSGVFGNVSSLDYATTVTGAIGGGVAYSTNGSSAIAETYESTPYIADDAEESFGDISDMLDFLHEREENAGWDIGVPSNSLSVDVQVGKENAPIKSGDIGLILRGLGFLMNNTPLRDCAITSMLDRARISGTALNHVTRAVFRDIVNECFAVAPKKATAKIRIADKKISAVLSENYVPLAIPEIFGIASEEISERFPNNTFVGGSWSHVITSCEWAFENEYGLVGSYLDALDRHGIDHKYVQPGLRLSSSDVGASSVNLMPKLVVGKNSVFLPLGGAIGLEHKNGASMENFQENLKGVFGQYRDRLSALEALLDIDISYPEGCFMAVIKRLNTKGSAIPKKYADPARERFSIGFLGGRNCTAHDVYCGLGELLFQMQLDNATGAQMIRMEESIVRALSLNFRDYDKPMKDE